MKRESDCPLCGAKISPEELLDACGELLDSRLGVLAARCPHCQGYIEVRPDAGQLVVGYLVAGPVPRFAQATLIACPGLEVTADAGTACRLVRLAERSWRFAD